MCKLRDVKLETQEMGQLPEAHLKQAPPFTYTMLDLFGPYAVRGEVQKRMTGKAYGVIYGPCFQSCAHRSRLWVRHAIVSATIKLIREYSWLATNYLQ